MDRERQALIALMLEMREAMVALTSLLRTLEQQVQRPPVQMDVSHLEVERLEFHLDSIDVQDLQGELHLGISQQVRLENAAPAPPEEKEVAQRDGPQPERNEVAIWPPPSQEVDAEP
ncbi:MAG: hypothetical protein ACOY5W_17175 [Pseudomonadota bacterium]